MKKEILNSNKAPAPVGPYSHAVRAGDMLYCSGQIPLDAKTGEILKGSVSEQAELVLSNVKTLLKDFSLNLDAVLKTSVFLTDMSTFNEFNEVYAKYFNESKPARSCVAVKQLPRGVDVEVEVIAAFNLTQ